MKTSTPSSIPVIPFDFESHEVRMQLIDDEPWFVAADVCGALSIANTARALSRLDDDEKGILSMNTLGGDQNLSVINESGLFSLILTSRKDEAKRFKKWVTSDVLPSIRRYGRYEDSEGKMETLVDQTIGTNGFNVLHDLIAKKAKVLPIGIQRQAKHRMWGMLHTRFNVPRAELIPANDMDSACDFVAAYAIEGEYIPASKNDDHITVNLPKAPNDRFDNLPASRLFGMDLIYYSKLTELLALLRKAIKNDQYVRVMDISAAGIEVEALRHWVEELVRLAESFQTNLNCIQSSSAQLLERWMTIFHPCINMLDGIVAHEFRERLVAIKAASGSLQRWMGNARTTLEQA